MRGGEKVGERERESEWKWVRGWTGKTKYICFRFFASILSIPAYFLSFFLRFSLFFLFLLLFLLSSFPPFWFAFLLQQGLKYIYIGCWRVMNQKWSDIFRFKDRTGTNDWLSSTPSLFLSLWYFFSFTLSSSFFLFHSIFLALLHPVRFHFLHDWKRRKEGGVMCSSRFKEILKKKSTERFSLFSLLSLLHSFFSLGSEMMSKNRSRKCASERKWLQPWSWRIFQERKKYRDRKRKERKRNRWEGKRVITTSIILLERVILHIFASLFLNPKLNHREERKRREKRVRNEGERSIMICLKWNQMETRRSSSLEFIPKL